MICIENYINVNNQCVLFNKTILFNCKRAYNDSANSFCYECEDGTYKFDSNKCYPPHTYIDELELSFYLEESLLMVRACDLSCKTCVNNSYKACDACRSNEMKYRLNENPVTHLFQCVQDCPPMTFGYETPEKSYCADCHTLCYTCFGFKSTECYSCTGRGLEFEDITITKTCLQSCPSHHYSNGTTCLICHEYCEECTDWNNYNCASCRSDVYELENVLLTFTCLLKCHSNYYLDLNKCKKCHEYCDTCFGPGSSKCLSCSSMAFPIEDVAITFKCTNKCPYHYFFRSSFCAACDESCGDCYGYGNERCNDCSILYKKLYSDKILTCVSQCPSNYFYMQKLNECVGKQIIRMPCLVLHVQWPVL